MSPNDYLKIINDNIKECTRCAELVENRTQTVFGVGNSSNSSEVTLDFWLEFWMGRFFHISRNGLAMDIRSLENYFKDKDVKDFFIAQALATLTSIKEIIFNEVNMK